MELQIFSILVLVFSIIIHEISHGFVAEKLGDPTARLAGRLTLNPISHIDPIGSLVLPAILIFTGSPILFGWAKPVPYDPERLKNPKVDAAKIAMAGPVSNLLIALLFGLALRYGSFGLQLQILFTIVVLYNIVLAVFNLLPIPPLDGSKVLFALLPSTEGAYRFMRSLEQYGFIILIILLFSNGLDFIQPLIYWLFRMFAGTSLGI